MSDVRKLLQEVRDGRVSVAEAELKLKEAPFADIGFAKVDLHRKLRQGAAEVIYGAGKRRSRWWPLSRCCSSGAGTPS